MTIYEYFDGKIGVLQTLWTLVFEKLFEQIEMELDSIPDAASRLLRFCESYTGYWIQNPEHYRLVFMVEGITKPDVVAFVENKEITNGFGLLAKIVAEALGRPVSDASVKLNADLLVGAMHGIAHNEITISGHTWCDHLKLIRHMVGLIPTQVAGANLPVAD